MKHLTTEEDWFAYLDDNASENGNSPIARHLQSCPTCRETVLLMRTVDRMLLRASDNVRATVQVSSASVAAAKEKALARLGNHSLSLRLGSLYLLLAPMCGVETSTRAICAAAQRVSADSPQFLEEGAWPSFIENLHTIIATLCGDPAASLVRERGMRLQQEAA